MIRRGLIRLVRGGLLILWISGARLGRRFRVRIWNRIRILFGILAGGLCSLLRWRLAILCFFRNLIRFTFSFLNILYTFSSCWMLRWFCSDRFCKLLLSKVRNVFIWGLLSTLLRLSRIVDLHEDNILFLLNMIKFIRCRQDNYQQLLVIWLIIRNIYYKFFHTVKLHE